MHPEKSWEVSYFAVAASVIAILGVLFHRFSAVKQDDREPTYLTSRIPFVGHLIHLIRGGGNYYRRLDLRYNLAIYTLPVLECRLYIVTSAEWATAVHRIKKLQFNNLIAQGIHKLFQFDDAFMALINHNLNGG